MATIKDIAKKAGVAQGTVSNVLNGKGNVSSDKIRRVLEAARQLGYVPNERAALLRKGTNDCLALVMPDSRARQYEDFYFSFKDYAQEHGLPALIPAVSVIRSIAPCAYSGRFRYACAKFV